MTNNVDEPNAELSAELSEIVAACLVAYEAVLQDVRFDDVAAVQQQLASAVRKPLARAGVIAREAGATMTKPLAALIESSAILSDAYDHFSRAPRWPDFASGFLASREAQVRALSLLYRECREYVSIAQFFDRSAIHPPRTQDTTSAIAYGPIEYVPSARHHEFSLFVPDQYSPEQAWPLVVALHGGHGSGREYLWTWVRPALEQGFIVLAPKSRAPTWSFLNPSVDVDSILAMIDVACAEFHIDQAQVLLTGLSDGGTFSFQLGLSNPERFAALAPIAGVLSPALDSGLRAGAGKSLPVHVVHGALDTIFPVQSARSSCELLKTLGYTINYTELPEWGHALTDRINDDIVWPWFTALHN